MARPLKLKPYKDRQSGKWCVNVVAPLSTTGRRQRCFFDTQAAALGFSEELKARRDNTAAIPELSVGQLLDAAAAFELLSEKGNPELTLLHAVRSFLEGESLRSGTVTLAELFRHFQASKEFKSASYKRDIQWARDKLSALLDLEVCHINRAHIAEALAGLPTSSRNNILRTCRALFRYGHDLGYLTEIPVRRNDFTQVKRTELEILAVGKIRKLLESALENDPALLPLLLVETFAGVRPAEAVRLEWTDLDFARARLKIRATVSKTGTARTIDLAPCAVGWFSLCKREAGALMPFTQGVLRGRLRKVREHAGWSSENPWKEGSLWDAFCSYHLAHYNSIDRLIQEAGHTSLKTTKDHYLGLVSREAAAQFWGLFPAATQEARIVAFGATV